MWHRARVSDDISLLIPARADARAMARAAREAGMPTAWFETLYRRAAEGEATVPWADFAPNRLLRGWLLDQAPRLGRALDVGCGYGDNADELYRRGFRVVAFDVAPTAVDLAQLRFPAVAFHTADLLAPPEAWRGAFDLVVEIYTLQALPPAPRAQAMAALASLVAPRGTLLVIARGRDADEPEGDLPWPLTKEELDGFTRLGLREESFDDLLDDEVPPVRRFRATYTRAT